jgi:hypothetical protein
VARDYMVRIGPRDFVDESSITKLAEAGGFTRAEFISRFEKFSQ